MNLLTKNKMFVGVIGLIAITSIVNTQAIISLGNYIKGSNDKVVLSAEDQEAQVSLFSSSCLEIKKTPGFNSWINPGGYTTSEHTGIIFFNLKNKCNVGVSVSSDTGGYNSMSGTPFSIHQPAVIEGYGGITTNDVQTHEFYGGVVGVGSTVSTYTYVPIINTSNLTSDPNVVAVNAINFNPLEEKQMYFYGSLGAYPEIHRVRRLSLRELKWFKTSDYTSDNMLTSQEFKTLTVPSAKLDDLRSAYFTFPGTQPSQNQVQKPTSDTIDFSKIESEIKKQMDELKVK